jgi:hypothetical protein
MGREELDMHQIPPSLAAKAMKVSNSSIHYWLSTGELKGEQTVSGRWWVFVVSCRAYIRRKKGPNSREEADFDAALNRVRLPQSPFPLNTPSEREEVVSCA